jgi:hypothetical protein
MRPLHALLPRHVRLRPPSRTIRLRLTVLYASLFLASGVGLLSITYVLVRHATGNVLVGKTPDGASFMLSTKGGATAGAKFGTTRRAISTFQGSAGVGAVDHDLRTEKEIQQQIAHDKALAERQHTNCSSSPGSRC